MQLTILTPQSKREVKIAWIEIETSAGNMVIQPGFAPAIFTLISGKQIIFSLDNGKQETLIGSGGIFEVNRSVAILLLNEIHQPV